MQISDIMLKNIFSKSNQPKLNLPINEKEKFTAIAGLLILTGMIAYTAISYSALPETIPTHFDGSGTPDGFGGKWTIWMMPFIAFLLTVMLVLLTRYPHTFNYLITITPENAEYQYRLARMLMLWLAIFVNLLFFLIQHSTIQVAFGRSEGLDMYTLLFAMAGNLVILIVYLIKSGQGK